MTKFPRTTMMRRNFFGARWLTLLLMLVSIQQTHCFLYELQDRLLRSTNHCYRQQRHQSPILPLVTTRKATRVSNRLSTLPDPRRQPELDQDHSWLLQRISQLVRNRRKPVTGAGEMLLKTVINGSFAILATILLISTPITVHASTLAKVSPTATSSIGGAAVAVAAIAARPVSVMVELKLTFRLVYAALIGAALGKERSLARHSAGVRTMALVAMGASAFTICSAFGFLNLPGRYDPSRMAANVASGVGFVGAGVITTSSAQYQQQPQLKGGASQPRSNVVHGLTTAATIWLSAAVGVACGVGLYAVATTTALTTILILRLGRIKPKARPPSTTEQSVTKQKRKLPKATTKIDYSLSQERNTKEEEHDHHVDDHYADTHGNSVWDEHPSGGGEQKEREEQQESSPRKDLRYVDSFSPAPLEFSSAQSILRNLHTPRKSRPLPYPSKPREDLIKSSRLAYAGKNSTRSGGVFFSYDEIDNIDLEVLEQYVERRRRLPPPSVRSEQQMQSDGKKDPFGP